MASILITTTAKFVRFKVGENPIKRFNKEVEATVTHDGFTNINVISNLIPLLTFKKDDDISINGDVQDPGMDIEDLCDAIQELFPDAGGSALTTVNTDETLTGDGSVGNPLGEANPITSEDITNWNEAAALAASALQSESDTLETVTTRGGTTDKDIEITDATKGIIMKTGDGTRVRVSVIKDGNGDIRLNPVILIFILCASLLFNSAKAQFQNLIGRDTVNLSYRLDTMSNYLLADNFYGRLTGLVVSYSGSGLTFNVTAGYFRLRDGALRFSPGGSITLSAADATNPRWDVIGVDTTGAIFKKTGSAAASPSIPQVDDPESQLELTSVEILANEVIPSTIVQNIIYDENSGDAFTGTNTGVTVNYNNTANVQHGTKSADVSSWTNGQTITFTKNTGTLNASDFTVLPFFIKLKSTLANTANVRISFLNGTTVVSNVLTLGATDGFSKNNTNYQNVSVAISRFTFTSTTFNKIKITLAGTGGGFYLDYIQLQSGLSVSSPETDPVANAKTVSMITGYGIIIPQSTTQTLNTNPTFTPSIDTFAVSTRAWRQKLADSLGAIIGTKISSAVTSVATNTSTGITGGTITSTGTLAIDTFLISTRAWRQKLADSLGTIIGTKLSVESDPIATAKTISVTSGTNITVTGTTTQSLNSNPSWIINSDDLDAYHTVTQLNDSIYTLNRPNGTKDTIQFRNISGTSFSLTTIGSSPNNNGATYAAGVFNLQPYDATHGGVTTTGSQTAAGDKIFTGNTFLTGTIATNATAENGNLNIPSAQGIAATSNAKYVGAVAPVEYRAAIGGGTTNITLAANDTYANVIIPVSTLTEASSGSHNNLASMWIGGMTITNAGASVTRTATLFLGTNAGASGASNYGLYNPGNSLNLVTPQLSSDANTLTDQITTATGAASFGAGLTNTNFYLKQTASQTSNITMNLNSSVTASGQSGTATVNGINSFIGTSSNSVANKYIAYRSEIANDGAGTISNAIGYDAIFDIGVSANVTAGTTTNVYGFKFETPIRTDSGHITNYWGVYIDTVKAAWVTGDIVGFYQKANFNNSIYNLFEGNLMIGAGTKSGSAALQMTSTTQGFLGPRMTNTQRDAISSPPEGLMIYSTTDHSYEFYNGTVWKTVATL